MRSPWLIVALATGLCLGLPASVSAQVPEEGEEPDLAAPLRLDQIPMPTMGGKQFWADELYFHKWRIQRNVFTGHYRLLDENNWRHCWGTLAECRAALEKIKLQRRLPPMEGKAVILLHGLADVYSALDGLARRLEEKGGYHVFQVVYPSTRESIADHARSLANVIENLEGIEQINFVGYSMGNIVIRRYLADQTVKARRKRPDPRIKRMVMIGPPNHGSELATGLAGSRVFRLMLGKPGLELGTQWVWEERSLAVPQFEFGIIAGGMGNNSGLNPLLPGDDDGVVTVASTRLAGAADFVVVPGFHALLPRNSKVQDYTLRFLEHGYFIAPDRRQPIRAE
jgi:pimeloyl-ACP methyl ester carboxylesterase